MRARLSMVATLAWLCGCDATRAVIVDHYPNDWGEGGVARAAEDGLIQGVFDDLDAERPKHPVALQPVFTGLSQPTDIQFPPGRSDVAVVLQKQGEAAVFAVDGPQARKLGTLLSLTPRTQSEQGLLGLAFHPDFGPTGGRVYVNHTTGTSEGDRASRVSVTDVSISGNTWTAGPLSTVLELPQPYANHNAGQLVFGPDRMLYVGWGDGGWRDDPHGHGQNGKTWLGTMLRIDVDSKAPYAVPKDNPFVEQDSVVDEAFAIGLRNPWRFAFDDAGRLIVADVGQNLFEEVNLVPPGANLGWNRREGRHCFPPSEGERCDTTGLTEPIYEYAHGTDGASITGGVVIRGASLPGLEGRYVFGDFVSGRIWAVSLPDEPGQAAPVTALGHFGVRLSTFGQDAAGHVFVADYAGGVIYRMQPAGSATRK